MKNKKYLFIAFFCSFLFFNPASHGAYIVFADYEETLGSIKASIKRTIEIYFDGENPVGKQSQDKRLKIEQRKEIAELDITSELLLAAKYPSLFANITSVSPALSSLHFFGINNDEHFMKIKSAYDVLKKNDLLHNETSFILWCKDGTPDFLQIQASTDATTWNKEIRTQFAQKNVEARERT